MKMLKKALCVFLSVLMLMSALSVSLVGFAAEVRSDADYRALAYSFFNYTIKSSGNTSSYVVNTDANGYPIRSIVGDMDQYTISNASSDYKYADEDENPIRAVSYDHKVVARDNSAGLIRGAATAYLAIVDSIISMEYGVGLYTIPMVADEVANALKFTKGDDGEYLFLDGYTYLVNAVGDIEARSPEKTYKVVDGEIVELSTDDSWLEPYADNMAAYTLMNLYEFCHVETIINYFSGNCTSVNSGNWFHSYTFYCETDIETILINEALVNQPVAVQSMTISWSMNRQYDDSGTKAQYYNNGYKLDKGTNKTDYTRTNLVTLQSALDGYFIDYLGNDASGHPMLDRLTNQNLLNYHYENIMTYYGTFTSISNAAKIAVFGQAAYSYVNLVTQLTPVVDATDPYNASYWPKHTYSKYQDAQGNDIVYQVDAQKVTTIVSTIDGLLKSERVGTVLKQFFDYTDPQYENMAYYYDAQNAKSAQDILKIVIADFLYNDDIINMLLGLLYPMVTDLLDDLITNEMINGVLNDVFSGLDSIVEWVVEDSDGWLALIYGVLSSIGVGLTPAGVAYVWDKYGYNNNDYFKSMTNNHNILKNAEGGTKSSSGNYSTPGYNAIGVEGDKYHLNRWDGVDVDKLVWDINGDRDRFENALCAILAPLASLLAVVLGNQRADLMVGDLIFDIYLYLKDIPLYNDVLLPLFETLGIPNLADGSTFESLAAVIVPDSGRNKQSVENFLKQGLLTPLLDWVENVVLADPIGTILNIVPNLSYYLTSGALLSSINSVEIPLCLKYAIEYGAVYTLVLGDLIGEDTIGFLDSLQGILDLIGFDVDTGVPIVGYHANGDTMVYKPGMAEYNPDYHNIPVTEAYISSAGMMNIYQNDIEFTTKITGLDENGNYTQYAVRNDIGWANASGVVVTEHNDSAPDTVYNIPVQEYYEYSVVVNEETGESTTYRVRYESMIPAEIRESGDYGHHQSIRTKSESASLPPIMDYKLQAVGTIETVPSGRYTTFSMTNREGISETWAAGYRKYVNVQVKGMETEGLVLLFLFRYLFSALMYRSYDANMQEFTSDYTLLDAFGLDKEMLTDDLFAGLKLQDIIDNVVLNPDGAIAALYELFYKNEYGSIFKVVNGIVTTGDSYSYAPEAVDYHADEILGYADEYEDYNYGTDVLYSEHWTKEKASYMVDNLDEIVDNVFKMLKLENMNTLGEFLDGFIGDLLFTNDMLSTIAGALYGLFADLGGDIDIAGILDAALDVDLSKDYLANALLYEFGDAAKKNGVMTNEAGEEVVITSIYNKLIDENAITAKYESDAMSAHASSDYDAYREYKALAAESAKYTDNTFYKIAVDQETGEEVELYAFDWGYNNPAITSQFSKPEIFLRGLSAIASPFAILIKFLFAGEDLSVLNLINIPGYEAFYYSWIPLMETLGANDGLVDFKQYYTRLFAGESTLAQNCDAIYYTVKPLIGFVEKVIANPVEVVLNLLPNLLFFISLGGLNDVLNNLVHFVYVLLDILAPVFDAYPLVNSLLSNLNVGGMQLNLSLPLDFDFNQLVNQLLEGLLGETLSFDIENENLVLGTQDVEKEVFIPTLDEDGNEQYDEEGNVIGVFETQTVTEDVYAVGTLSIALPYIDFSTLCAGTIIRKLSVSGQEYVYLNGAGGADLITLIFRIVTDTLFFMDNAVNIANFLIGFCQLEDENDSDDLLLEIFTYLNVKANEAALPDMILSLIYTIYKLLVPIAGELGSRFGNVDFSITDLFDGMSDSALTQDRISALLGAGGETNPTLSGFARLIDLIKQFFAKLEAFFKALFGGGLF